MTNKYTIYTDGACSGNPGPGGWGVLIMDEQGHSTELSGRTEDTTNNRMELMATIEGLQHIGSNKNVTLVTDSTYVKDGITKWIHSWKKNGWKTANKKPVKNIDLWQALDSAAANHQIKWEWVKGHSGHPENDRVDHLARTAILEK